MVKRYNRVYYYSSRTNDLITIEATPENDLDLCQGMTGPYDDMYIAYGVQCIEKNKKHSETDDQFSMGARVVFNCHIDCDGHDYCIMRTTGSVEAIINVSPINKFAEIETGTQMMLRICGRSDDICVYNTPEELQNDIHLPPKILIPIGTYHDYPEERDTSAVITGCVKRVTLISQQGYLRYLLTVQTLAMEVDIEVKTYYEIHIGNFVYVRTNLSARF